MRVFVAIPMRGELLAALSESSEDMAAVVPGRRVDPAGYHVTLAFLGEVEDDALASVKAAMDAAFAGFSSFDATLDALGHFGSEDDALVWQGFDDSQPFEELAAALREELSVRQIAFDDKPFVPHVTLMRRADITGEVPLPFAETDIINAVGLLATHFIDGKPQYELLHEVQLHDGCARRQEGRALFIDADACPVTAEALAAAREFRMPAVIVGNSTQNLYRHVRKTDATEPKEGFWVEVLEVGVGPDAADFSITQMLRSGDVVVTQDTGLAAMALGTGAKAIGPRGHIHTKGNIDLSMEIRHVEKKLRRAGTHTAGPSAFTQEDRSRFVRNLRRLLKEQ